MLLRFGLKNYMSFKEGVVLSFKLDAKVPRAFSHVKGVSPILAIKGANASGKTNILRGLSFISVFAAHSFAIRTQDLIPLSSHFENKEPTDFFVEFSTAKASYLYEFRATEHKIVREAIYRTKSKKTKLIERVGDEFTYLTKEFERFQSIKLRKNVSLISIADQYSYDELKDVHEFFSCMTSNVSYRGLEVEPITESEAAELLYSDKDLLDFVSGFISECDVGVSQVQVIADTSTDKQTRYFPVYLHGPTTDAARAITSQTESSGTRALFRNLVRYKTALDRGSVMIADEIDIHLHPDIIPKIISLFLDPKINNRGAQLIFSTHDSDVLDLLGRYRTFLVNKSDNESFGYRLDEIPGDMLRNDRPISPLYKSGKIGGIPRL